MNVLKSARMKCLYLIIFVMKNVQIILKIMSTIKLVYAIQIWDIGINMIKKCITIDLIFQNVE